MHYTFPLISDIDQVRTAIAGRDEFKENDMGDYITFIYQVNFEDTFPPVLEYPAFEHSAHPKFSTNQNAAIRRECRGIIFDKRTGKVIRRPFHKFFNLNEKAETRAEAVDFIKNKNVILEKLDGSMIVPFRLHGSNEILWGTKAGVTDVANNAKEWVEKKPNYLNFVRTLLYTGHSPIFEWCSRKNRIVIDYPIDRLVLTAVRHIETGIYWPIMDIMHAKAAWELDTVGFHYDLDIPDMMKTLEGDLEGMEGYIVRFEETGHMVKVKGSWYLQMHKTLEHIQHEKDLIRLILEDRLDDAKAFLPADLVVKLDKFAQEMFSGMRKLASDMAWDVIADHDLSSGSKKKFAELTISREESGLRFTLYDFMIKNPEAEIKNLEDEMFEQIRKKIGINLSSQTKVNAVRHLFGGIKWEI